MNNQLRPRKRKPTKDISDSNGPPKKQIRVVIIDKQNRDCLASSGSNPPLSTKVDERTNFQSGRNTLLKGNVFQRLGPETTEANRPRPAQVYGNSVPAGAQKQLALATDNASKVDLRHSIQTLRRQSPIITKRKVLHVDGPELKKRPKTCPPMPKADLPRQKTDLSRPKDGLLRPKITLSRPKTNLPRIKTDLQRQKADLRLPTPRIKDRSSLRPSLNDETYLHKLANSNAEMVVKLLSERERELQELLRSSHVAPGSKILPLLVKLFAKLGTLHDKPTGMPISTTPHQPKTRFLGIKLKEIMQNLMQGGNFTVSLANLLCEMPTEGNLSKRKDCLTFLHDTIVMCNLLLDVFPFQASRHLFVIDTCACTAIQLGKQQSTFREVSQKAQSMLQKRDSIREGSYERSHDSHYEQEFSVVLPTPEELHQDRPFLEKNMTKEAFPSAAIYLKIQFELLREDFLSPLRHALRAVTPKTENDDESQDVIMYKDVHFDQGQTFSFSGPADRISFKTPHKINWNRCKNLQYGSLVCLSKDNFQTVLYATISDRNTDDLNKGIVSIQLQNCLYEGGVQLSPPSMFKFSMIESPGYYEAYAPVIKRLDKFISEPDELPFKNYLVDLAKDVDLPHYLKDKQAILDLKGIVCNCRQVSTCDHENVDILNKEEWDTLETPLLDPSQKEALHMALTNELALIQGPPGTGKTYVGLKVIETLMRNKHLWQSFLNGSPILVICYTNHALDQFLEGILRIKPYVRIVRMGSRSKNEAVSQFNLQKYVKRLCREQHIFHPMRFVTDKQKMLDALEEFINGHFHLDKCELYCYYLSNNVLEDIKSYCDLPLQDVVGVSHGQCEFASWLDPTLAAMITSFYKGQGRHEDYFLMLYARRELPELFTQEAGDIFLALRHEGIERFVKKFGKVEPLTDRSAKVYFTKRDRASDHIRLQLFKYCLKQLYLKQSIEWKHTSTEKQDEYEEQRHYIKLGCLMKADVIGLTTTAAAKDNLLLSKLHPKIMIIEEAAEVLEPQIVASLTKSTQHLILIGDHKQLRPKTNDYEIGREYRLEISMFERLVDNKFPLATLKLQHRMCPEISEIVSQHIYNGVVKDHEETRKYESVRGMKFNMFFVDHSNPESPNTDLKSPSNLHEAKFLTALCKYLLQQGYQPSQITVITPYVGQMFELKSQLKETFTDDKHIHVTPIDGYQGEENDIILLSLVRSERPGFVKDENRICVALSRAKKGLYCIGNFDLFSRSNKLWKDIKEHVQSKERLGTSLPLQCVRHKKVSYVSSATDFCNVADGGCDEMCEERLPACNHVCPRKCHPYDELHDEPCKEDCPKYCATGKHRCKRRCFEKCGNCEEKVEKVIKRCGHTQLVPCHMSAEKFTCQEECEKTLECGHPCKKKCGEKCTIQCESLVKKDFVCGHSGQVECYLDPLEATKKCKHPCGELLECEHICSSTCGKCRQGRLHAPCTAKCTRILICGHPCSGSCSKNCPPCSEKCMYTCQHGPCGHPCYKPCRPCPHECEWKCAHYKCSKNCDDICDRPRCYKKCPKRMKCGHHCIGVCGEPCPKVCRTCLSKEEFKTKVNLNVFCEDDNEDMKYVKLEDCGHIFGVENFDQWMDTPDEKIKWKCCLQCHSPVLKTPRYSNIAKIILRDINEVKKHKNIFTSTERKKVIEELSKLQFDELAGKGYITQTISNWSNEKWCKYVEGFNDFGLHKVYLQWLTALDMMQAERELLIEVKALSVNQSSSKTQSHLLEKIHLLLSQTTDFLEWIKVYKRSELLTDQMTIDIKAEHRRILLLLKMYRFEKYSIKVDEVDQQLLTKVSKYETNASGKIGKFTDSTEYEFLKSQLDALPNKYGLQVPLTLNERRMIIKAIGAKRGSWYKCPQGHYYQIGECGGAMETSKCPECGSTIGGHSHQLDENNQHAGEFDGSRHAAWSEGANLGNFDLENLV